ncbi:RNA polymerase II transcription factor B subunit 4 [Chytriomyces hyalinus]|nr:RNA polymerase II transcription factor B subunit 4 [Chytriomyces hyalinus]KAJ3264375.1 RNA polymerase II transcription factor B subunit 4 [Chytriomyces hyalinus]
MDVLVLVLDLFPLTNGLSKETLARAVHHILVFVNAHLALRFDGRVAVVAATASKGGQLILASDAVADSVSDGRNSIGMYKQFKQTDDVIAHKLVQLLSDSKSVPADASSSCVASALSIALSYINRIKKTNTDSTIPIQARILVISVSPDSPHEYIPIMNTIFAAKKDDVIIDVCRLLGSTSLFLSQTAASTGGVFVQVSDLDNLVTVLLHSFLPEPAIRNTLCLPGGGAVDFRASCFCHKRPCEIAFVCSVCLSIFCQKRDVCMTCGSDLVAQQ